jgi:hypothetical protein
MGYISSSPGDFLPDRRHHYRSFKRNIRRFPAYPMVSAGSYRFPRRDLRGVISDSSPIGKQETGLAQSQHKKSGKLPDRVHHILIKPKTPFSELKSKSNP